MVTESIQNGGNPKLDTEKEKALEPTNSTLKQMQWSLVTTLNDIVFAIRLND